MRGRAEGKVLGTRSLPQREADVMLFFFLEAAKLNAPTPGSSFQIQTTAVLPALFQTFLPTAPGPRSLVQTASLPCPPASSLQGASPCCHGSGTEAAMLAVCLSDSSFLGWGEDQFHRCFFPLCRCPDQRPGRPCGAPTALTALPQAPFSLSYLPRPHASPPS